MVDTHCHLNIIIKKNPEVTLSLDNLPTIKDIVSEARKNEIKKIINVGTSVVESYNSILIAKDNEDVYASVGVHPTDLTNNWKKDINSLEEWIKKKHAHKIVGIGECGLDLFHKNTTLDLQKDGFKAQIELALKYQLPLIIHSRNAYDETLRVLEEFIKDSLRGVFHCFSYDRGFAKQAVEWGFMLGIGGTVTYPKNEELRHVVSTCPITNIVLETDAPFLPIQSMRGKQNHPLYIKSIAQAVATIRSIPFENVRVATTDNAFSLFALKDYTHHE